MYQPPAFRDDTLANAHALITAQPLGLLISHGPKGILANPVPFLLDPSTGPHGTLFCHLARANEQWRALRDHPAALVVFQGVDGYVTPSWYETKRETGKVVPTWNYATVQVRGDARVHDDPAWLHAHVSALTAGHEAQRERPWAVTDAPAAYIASQLKGIVGLEIPIASFAGKWKVSQNRPPADRAGVAAGLAEAGDPASRAMAAVVRQRGGI